MHSSDTSALLFSAWPHLKVESDSGIDFPNPVLSTGLDLEVSQILASLSSTLPFIGCGMTSVGDDIFFLLLVVLLARNDNSLILMSSTHLLLFLILHQYWSIYQLLRLHFVLFLWEEPILEPSLLGPYPFDCLVHLASNL